MDIEEKQKDNELQRACDSFVRKNKFFDVICPQCNITMETRFEGIVPIHDCPEEKQLNEENCYTCRKEECSEKVALRYNWEPCAKWKK